MVLPNYRAWVPPASVVVCLAVWALIEKTSLGATPFEQRLIAAPSDCLVRVSVSSA